jgi:hypothetical protein
LALPVFFCFFKKKKEGNVGEFDEFSQRFFETAKEFFGSAMGSTEGKFAIRFSCLKFLISDSTFEAGLQKWRRWHLLCKQAMITFTNP